MGEKIKRVSETNSPEVIKINRIVRVVPIAIQPHAIVIVFHIEHVRVAIRVRTVQNAFLATAVLSAFARKRAV